MRNAFLSICLLSLSASTSWSDVREAIEEHVIPIYNHLVVQTEALSKAAQKNCIPESLKPAYHDAYDAWVRASHIQFGPIEDAGLSLSMDFWPDPRGTVPRTLARLTADSDPAVKNVQDFSEVSAAAQGFQALERMLLEPQPDAEYACDLTRAISDGLALKSAQLEAAWPPFAELMLSAGQNGNTRFQTPREAQRALYTALSTGLEFLHDQRLGRPLGTFDRPRPRRAEAYRSERSLRHIILSLEALDELASALVGDIPKTRTAFERAKTQAGVLGDPALQGVATPAERIPVETLQRIVRDIQVAVASEIGEPLGISAGFNSLDGD